MNWEKFEAIFDSKAKPWLVDFHQKALDFMGRHPWSVFYPCTVFAMVGAIAIVVLVLR